MWAHYIADAVLWGAFAWFAWHRNAFQEWGWREWLTFATVAAIPVLLAHTTINLLMR